MDTISFTQSKTVQEELERLSQLLDNPQNLTTEKLCQLQRMTLEVTAHAQKTLSASRSLTQKITEVLTPRLKITECSITVETKLSGNLFIRGTCAPKEGRELPSYIRQPFDVETKEFLSWQKGLLMKRTHHEETDLEIHTITLSMPEVCVPDVEFKLLSDDEKWEDRGSLPNNGNRSLTGESTVIQDLKPFN